MSKAKQFLQQHSSQMMQNVPNVDPSKYIAQNQQAMQNYQGSMNQGMQNYQQASGNYLNSIKQQTQMRINALNQQLEANKAKYKVHEQQQTANIKRQHQQADEQIDQHTFNQYKYANQMGAQRGVSASAQQMAMDNQVGQMSAGMFQQNMQQKNDSLNELQTKIAMGMLDLDMAHNTNVTNLLSEQMKQEGQFNMQVADKQMQMASSMADKIMAQAMHNNEIQFKSEKEAQAYKSEIMQKLFQMGFSEAQGEDSFARQKDMALFNHNLDLQRMAQQQRYNQANAKASASKGKEHISERDILSQSMFQYATEVLGMQPDKALDWVNGEMDKRYAMSMEQGKGMPNVNVQPIPQLDMLNSVYDQMGLGSMYANMQLEQSQKGEKESNKNTGNKNTGQFAPSNYLTGNQAQSTGNYNYIERIIREENERKKSEKKPEQPMPNNYPVGSYKYIEQAIKNRLKGK